LTSVKRTTGDKIDGEAINHSAAFEMQPGTSVYESPALNQADETPPISKTVVNDTKNIFYFDGND
jgi:hypothetical protein